MDADVYARLLYYNPELTASSNLVTPREVKLFFESNNVNSNDYIHDDSALPPEFDAQLFLSDYKAVADISALNQIITAAMLLEGFDESQLRSRSVAIQNIFADAVVESLDESNNTVQIKFNYLAGSASNSTTVVLGESNVNSGDVVLLKRKFAAAIPQYATVLAVPGSDELTLSNLSTNVELGGVGIQYIVYGIKVVDVERIGKINYLRALAPPPLVPPPYSINVPDPTFNAPLYRLLYPESASLSDTESYQEYVNYRDNNVLRIGRTTDFVANAATSTSDYVDVAYRLTIGDLGAIAWRDKIVYAISQDDVRRSVAVSKSRDNLMTEWAIKKYVDRNFDEVAVFNDVVVRGSTLLQGRVDVTGDIINASNLAAQQVSVSDGFASCNITVLSGDTSIAGRMVIPASVTASNTVHFLSNVVFDGQTLFNGDIASEGDAYFKKMRLDDLFLKNFTASNIITDTLIATDIDSDTLQTTTAFFATSTACNSFVDNLSATYMSGIAAQFATLAASNAGVSNLHVETKASIEKLEVQDVVALDLSASNAFIHSAAMSNVAIETATLCNLTCALGNVTSLQVVDASVLHMLRASNLQSSNASIDELATQSFTVNNVLSVTVGAVDVTGPMYHRCNVEFDQTVHMRAPLTAHSNLDVLGPCSICNVLDVHSPATFHAPVAHLDSCHLFGIGNTICNVEIVRAICRDVLFAELERHACNVYFQASTFTLGDTFVKRLCIGVDGVTVET